MIFVCFGFAESFCPLAKQCYLNLGSFIIRLRWRLVLLLDFLIVDGIIRIFAVFSPMPLY